MFRVSAWSLDQVTPIGVYNLHSWILLCGRTDDSKNEKKEGMIERGEEGETEEIIKGREEGRKERKQMRQKIKV